MQKSKLMLGMLAAAGLILNTGCGKKSTSEKVGDHIGQASEDIEDKVTHDGPKENAKEAKDKVKDEIKDRSD